MSCLHGRHGVPRNCRHSWGLGLPCVVGRTGVAGGRRRRRYRQTGSLPGVEATIEVGGAMESEILQARGSEARAVPLGAEDHYLDVVIDRSRNVGSAGRVEPPFEHVALDDERSGNLALRATLRGWADVDEERATSHCGRRLLRRETMQSGTGFLEHVIDCAPSSCHRSFPACSSDAHHDAGRPPVIVHRAPPRALVESAVRPRANDGYSGGQHRPFRRREHSVPTRRAALPCPDRGVGRVQTQGRDGHRERDRVAHCGG